MQIADPDGILDPTNPYRAVLTTTRTTKIEPAAPGGARPLQPGHRPWYTRYRGFIEEMDYAFDPSQQVNRLQLTLVDIFEILSAIEMLRYPAAVRRHPARGRSAGAGVLRQRACGDDAA